MVSGLGGSVCFFTPATGRRTLSASGRAPGTADHFFWGRRILRRCIFNRSRPAQRITQSTPSFQVLVGGVSRRRRLYPDRGLETAYMDPSRFARLRFSIGIRLRAYIRLLIRGISMAPSHDVIRFTGATLLRGSDKPCDLAARPVPVLPMVHRSLCNRKVVFLPVLCLCLLALGSCPLAAGPQAAWHRIAQAWRAFLLARATAARFLPRRSTSARSHRLFGSVLSPRCLIAARAPWISSARSSF